MNSGRINYEFLGSVNKEWVWKDNLYYFHSLKVKTELCYHSGCVNTICWDDHGEYILSGSDDRCIAIANAFSQDSENQNVYTLKLPAYSNIFTAKFLPFSCGSEIVVGFKCGCVTHVNPNSSIKDSLKNIFCHSFAVYDILTLQEMPTCFITLSHDRSATLLDTRATSVVRKSSSCSRGCFNNTNSPWVSNFSVVNQLKFHFPVTAGDIHPLNGCCSIALATADGFVRLFDIRKLVSTLSSSAAVGDPPQPTPFRVARPLGLPAKINSNKTFRLNYGPGHITSVKFEPIYDKDHTQFLLPTGRKQLPSSDLGGKHLLVSHMYAPVFLYDLYSEEAFSDSEVQRPDWLPNTDTCSPSSETESLRSSDSLISDPNIRLTVALYRWLTQHRSRTDESAVDEASTESQTTSSSPAESTTGQTSYTGSQREQRLPIDYLTDAYISDVINSSPRCREIMKYCGRECCSTVVKVSTFWGRNFILSGSECGHLIAWDRNTGKPALAIKADTSVVNRIIPHPRFPMIAVSGIDRSIKIIEPDPNVYEQSEVDDGDDHEKSAFIKVVKQHEEEANQLCQTNDIRTKKILSSGNNHLDSIARLRAGRVARMILLRLVEGTNSTDSRYTDTNT
ncbi:unnamed protein product [Schistosoma rodhaini]|uniref:WD_REPEATS_REGION domain-containing protein n=2 Tax=Schistosoma rodhaini TaxID=6188 RepID=A0AA85EPN6_9TREM|nr:unnamed protein product [Schistosoma rodhaini]CAH8681825.1 unnamed protein product [Schistosoma rodhaini]